MKNVKVKICGITNFEDARAAIDARCDALGFSFYRKSPRYINPEKARAIIRRLPQRIAKVGVFCNARENTIRQIARACGLSMLQLHGSESPAFCNRLKGFRVVKAFRIKNRLKTKDILQYKVSAYLFDSFVRSKPGGTGKVFNWAFIPRAGELKAPVFLSGGLSRMNVRNAIQRVHPQWVDACSSVEIKPGKKDSKKVRDFINAAKKVRI